MGIMAELENSFELVVVSDFCSHYSIMCDSMEPLIIKLQYKQYYKESANELYCIFHNLASASSFLELNPINKLSSLAGETLRVAQDLEGPASKEFIDWLLLVSDQFAKYREDLEDDKEIFSILEPLIVRIPVNFEAS